MGVISGSSSNEFKSSVYLYSKVKRFLTSFDAVGLIDEGEFDIYTKEALDLLGCSAYKEAQTIKNIKNFKTQLPDDFSKLYVAYKCTPIDGSPKSESHQQSNVAFVIDITDEIVESDGCTIECFENSGRTLERINIKTSVNIENDEIHFGNITPLRLSPNVNRDFCVDGCANLMNSSYLEISINNGFLYTNFNDDYVYMKYYAIPRDADGNMEIPNVASIEKMIEWYIIYQLMLSMWFNNDSPDIQQRLNKAEAEYKKAFGEAKYEIKLPAFSELVDSIRNKRSQNKLVFMTSQYSNTGFQATR